MQLPNYTPGFVASYNADTRRVRVSIPGVTDGADVLPEAMLRLPIGQNTDNSELRILPGDRVWLDFINGDARYPIITGYRTKDTDNAVDWLRFAQVNIELRADTDMVITGAGGRVNITAGSTVTITAPSIVLDGPVHCTQTLAVDGNATVNNLASATDVTAGAISLKIHHHTVIGLGNPGTGSALP